MLEAVHVVAAIAVGLAWLGIWAGLLHLIGVAPIRRTAEQRRSRRERLRRLGVFWYIVTFGVLGSGVALGLAITSLDFISNHSRGWNTELFKFVFLALLFGLFQGFGSWRRTFRDPIPFPPDYPPAK